MRKAACDRAQLFKIADVYAYIDSPEQGAERTTLYMVPLELKRYCNTGELGSPVRNMRTIHANKLDRVATEEMLDAALEGQITRLETFNST